MAAILELVIDASKAQAGAAAYRGAAAQVQRSAASASSANQQVNAAAATTAAGVTRSGRQIETAFRGVDRTARQSAAQIRDFFTFFVAFQAVRGGLRSLAEFEDSLVAVGKTTDTVGPALERLGEQFQLLSLPQAGGVPVPVADLLETAAAAGQLGVRGSRNLLLFSETLARLAESTDVAGEEGARSLARVLDLTGEGAGNIFQAGTVLARLGDEFAATDSQILAVAEAVAQSTTQFNLSSTEALAYGAALRATGSEADASGTAIRRALASISVAAAQGGRDLRTFAEVAGLSAEEFRSLVETEGEAAGLERFLEGLGQIATPSQIQALQQLGLGTDRLSKALLPLANRYEVLRRALGSANEEAEEQQSLLRQSEQAFDTLGGSLQGFSNTVRVAFLQLRRYNGPLRTAVDTSRDAVDATFELTTTWEDATPAARNLARAVEGIGVALGGGLLVKIGASLFATLGSFGTLAIAATAGLVAYRRELSDFALFVEGVNRSIFADEERLVARFQVTARSLASGLQTTLSELAPAIGTVFSDTRAVVREALNLIFSDFEALFNNAVIFIEGFGLRFSGALSRELEGIGIGDILLDIVQGDGDILGNAFSTAFAEGVRGGAIDVALFGDSVDTRAFDEARARLAQSLTELRGLFQLEGGAIAAAWADAFAEIDQAGRDFEVRGVEGINAAIDRAQARLDQLRTEESDALAERLEGLRGELANLLAASSGQGGGRDLPEQIEELERAGQSFGRSFSGVLADLALGVRDLSSALQALLGALVRGLFQATIGNALGNAFGNAFSGGGTPTEGGGTQPLTISGGPPRPSFLPSAGSEVGLQPSFAASGGGGGAQPSFAAQPQTVVSRPAVTVNVYGARDVDSFVARRRNVAAAIRSELQL